MLPQWTVPTNYELLRTSEQSAVDIPLPLVSIVGVTTKVISGELPSGLRLENNRIVGRPFEVARETQKTFVIRASTNEGVSDRTFKIVVEGSDNPQWITPAGRLPVGPNNVYFILDSSIIDFQLLASDTDLPAGDVLKYYIADGDGELPPGIQLTEDGRIVGVVDPILALDISADLGGYDTAVYGNFPFDFSVVSDSGLDSFYYDTTLYDYSVPTRVPKKLNRLYEFVVTVTDNVSFTKRNFQIYVVGDDFTRADNTIMKAADGVFTADITYIRNPIWLTPADLGMRRANNFITVYLDTLNPPYVSGEVLYFLETINDDGSLSVLPPGLTLDSYTGELAGIVPYQPAITKEYKFTVRASRFNELSKVVTVFGTYNYDVLSGNKTFRIAKLPIGLEDGLDDLNNLVNQEIVIENKYYTVESVDGSNKDYDSITLKTALEATGVASPLAISKSASGNDYFFVRTLSDADRAFYTKKNLTFSDTETYRIENIYPYVEWKVYVNDSSSSIELNTDIVPITGTYAESLANFLSITENPAYVTIVEGTTGVIEISLTIPSTAQNRNSNFIKSLFNTADSSQLFVDQLGQDDRIQLDVPLNRTLDVNRQLSLGTYRGSFFTKTFSKSEVDVASKNKTFTIRLLGEVDSTITWLTNKDLGILNANRISTLSVKAVTSVPDTIVKYNIVAGKLPPGLVLKTDGEIVGKVPVNGTADTPGLTFFDTGKTTFDGATTTLDRVYKFTILARDRFGFSAVTREFTLTIGDLDNLTYSNIYMKPFLKSFQKQSFLNLINDSKIIDPRLIYRPSDPNFGVQRDLKSLVYAGIETADISTFVSASAKNHKRKRFYLGDVKTAVAKNEGSNEIVYEVVYIDLIDPAKPKVGKTAVDFKIINNSGKITADSVKLEANDDLFASRNETVSINVPTPDGLSVNITLFSEDLSIVLRDGEFINYNANGSVSIILRNGRVIPVSSSIANTESLPNSWRFRPTTNTITADSNAVKISQKNDIKKYISNIDNMRSRIKETGSSSRDFLPLWMRTPQDGSLSELDYVLAIPLVYCKPGTANTIKENILNSKFNFTSIDYDIDRYIIDTTTGNSNEQYILFANYQFNV